jgi:hypothetical protein
MRSSTPPDPDAGDAVLHSLYGQIQRAGSTPRLGRTQNLNYFILTTGIPGDTDAMIINLKILCKVPIKHSFMIEI